MNNAMHALIAPFKGMSAVLDANVMLLYICAEYDPRAVKTFKRLNSFSEGDFELLKELLSQFTEIRTIPNIWTEVSNFAHDRFHQRSPAWLPYFAEKITKIPENWIASAQASGNQFFELGVTDACLAELAKDNVVISIDWPLVGRLESLGLNVLNFNSVRFAGIQ